MFFLTEAKRLKGLKAFQLFLSFQCWIVMLCVNNIDLLSWVLQTKCIHTAGEEEKRQISEVCESRNASPWDTYYTVYFDRCVIKNQYGKKRVFKEPQMKEAVGVLFFFFLFLDQPKSCSFIEETPIKSFPPNWMLIKTLSFSSPLTDFALYCTERRIQRSCLRSIPISDQTRGSMAIQISMPKCGINSATTVVKIETGSQ